MNWPSNRLLNADNEPNNWLMQGKDVQAHRYSSLTEINRDNVNGLHMVWAMSLGGANDVVDDNGPNIMATPLVDNGIMYTISSWGRVFKIDVRKLKELGLTESLDIGYRISPRGLAVLGEDPAQAHTPRHPLPRVGASAARALRAAALDDLDDVAAAGRRHVAALPGLGAVGLARLDEALEDAGLTWA